MKLFHDKSPQSKKMKGKHNIPFQNKFKTVRCIGKINKPLPKPYNYFKQASDQNVKYNQ